MSRKGRALEAAFDIRWGDLAQFNTERNRGIVHDPEYVRYMAWKQQQYTALSGFDSMEHWTCPVPATFAEWRAAVSRMEERHA